MDCKNGVTPRAGVVHFSATNHSNLFTVLEDFQDILVRVYRECIDTTDGDGVAYLDDFRLLLPFSMRINQIPEFFVVDLKIRNSDRCCETVSAILLFFIAENVLEAHLKQSFFWLFTLNRERFS
jgi:hypothetical protein